MQSVLYITKKKIFLKNSNGKTATIDWNGLDIQPVFKTLKKTLKPGDLNIILGNDLSYTLALEASSNPTRQQILDKAKEHIPENIDSHNFDWQKKGNFIQVIATPFKFLNNLSLAAKLNKIQLGSIQTAAIVLAESTASIKSPHLILHKSQEDLIVSSYQGVVFFAHNQPNLNISILVNIASITKQKYNLDIMQVVISGTHVDKSISIPAQWELVKKNTDIMATASKDKKTTTKDQDELEIKPVVDPVEETEEELRKDDPELEESDSETSNEETKEEKELETNTDKEETADEETIQPESQPEPTFEDTTDEDSDIVLDAANPVTPEIKFDQDSEPKDNNQTKTKSNKGLFISLAITLVVGGSLTGGILYSRSATTNQDIRSQAAETTPTPTLALPSSIEQSEDRDTPEEISLSDYSLQVQNGSGTAGQAGVVDELLQAEGFEAADTTNADSYDYTKTEVQLKKDTPESVFNAIDRALNSDYDVTTGDVLDEDSKYDVIVIVGAKK